VLVLRAFDALGCGGNNGSSYAGSAQHLLFATEYEGQLMHLRKELAQVKLTAYL
jgi:hypothetical protein